MIAWQKTLPYIRVKKCSVCGGSRMCHALRRGWRKNTCCGLWLHLYKVDSVYTSKKITLCAPGVWKGVVRATQLHIATRCQLACLHWAHKKPSDFARDPPPQSRAHLWPRRRDVNRACSLRNTTCSSLRYSNQHARMTIIVAKISNKASMSTTAYSFETTN